MKLENSELLKLAPEWMREDASNKALADGVDDVTRRLYARLKLLTRWDKIDQLGDQELDEIAADLKIPWYESAAPVEIKRAVVKNSDLVYSKLGTPFAVEQIITDYFGDGEVKEWYQYGGAPFHFKVLSSNPSLVNDNLDRFLNLLKTVKRRSAWLDAVMICLTGEMLLYAGMGVRETTSEIHAIGSEEINVYHSAIVHDNNHETVTIGNAE